MSTLEISCQNDADNDLDIEIDQDESVDTTTAQKMKFSIKDFFSKCDQIQFTKEILNGKLHFLCSALHP